MKVLHVVNDASTGGAQTLIEQLARQLAPGVESHILVLLGRGPLSVRFESCSASVTYMDMNKRSLRVDTLIRRTRSVIEALHPDVVHSHLLQADLAVAFACIGLDLPVISTVHTTGMSSHDPLRSRILGRFLGLISNAFIDKSIACGEGAAAYMRVNGYASSKSAIVRNGVALGAVPNLNGTTVEKSLLCLSRWHPMKDHETLFDAFKIVLNMYPESHLVCAGAGITNENDELTSIIGSRGVQDSVTLLGPVQDVRSLLRQSSMLVITSAYGEALPMAGLEALAEGIPVITTSVGDCPNLTVESWQCVPPNQPNAFADAISRLFSLSRSEYSLISEASFTRVRDEYSIESAAASYSLLYEECMLSKVESA